MKDFLMKRIKKKRLGFTLIELLAVIAVLAIILLIAVPSVISIIGEARLQAYKKSEQFLAKGATNYLYDKSITIGDGLTIRKSIADLSGYTGDIKDAITKNDCLGYTTATTTSTSVVVDPYINCDTYTTPGYSSDPNLAIMKNFGGSGSDRVRFADKISDGYLITGRNYSNDGTFAGMNRGNSDAYLIKMNNNGDIVWVKTFGGTGFDDSNGAIEVDDGYIFSIRSESTDGDMAGLSKGGGKDAAIFKVDFNGDIMWKKSFGGSLEDEPSILIKDADGFAIAGTSNSTNGDLTGLNKGWLDQFIAKYDLSGNLLWTKTRGGTNTDTIECGGLAYTGDGYVIMGRYYSTNGDFTGLNRGQSDLSLTKYDLSGNFEWMKTYGGAGEELGYLVEKVSDGYVMSVASDSTNDIFTGLNKGLYDAVIMKTDLNGNLLWNKNFGGSASEYPYQLTINGGEYIISHASPSVDGDMASLSSGSGYTPFMATYDTLGNLTEKYTFGTNLVASFNGTFKNGSETVMFLWVNSLDTNETRNLMSKPGKLIFLKLINQ